VEGSHAPSCTNVSVIDAFCRLLCHRPPAQPSVRPHHASASLLRASPEPRVCVGSVTAPKPVDARAPARHVRVTARTDATQPLVVCGRGTPAPAALRRCGEAHAMLFGNGLAARPQRRHQLLCHTL